MPPHDEIVGSLFGGSRTPKVRLDGTFRSRQPEETLELIRPHMKAMGITRVANVTGLDRIGIPTFMVVRPNGRGLAVSQGKGMDDACARVSGIMESIECHHAEYTSCEVIHASYEALTKTRVALLDPTQLPLSRYSRYAPSFELAWAEGHDVVTGERGWVPYELVHTDFRYPPPPGGECFLKTSNGLASGNSLVEATLHALCEVVERDAGSVLEAKPGSWEDGARLDLTTVDDPVCSDLLNRFERAGVSVLAWDVTSDVGVATFRAIIFDRSADALLYPMVPATGTGTHPAREIALCRALTEAAQSRLTFIAGSRDDVTRRARAEALKGCAHYANLEKRDTGRTPFAASPTYSGDTIEEDLAYVLGGVRKAGGGRVAVVDLSRPEIPISVVRVIASGLEGMSESPGYVPGARARAAAGLG